MKNENVTGFKKKKTVISSLACQKRVKIAFWFSHKMSFFFVQARLQNHFITKQDQEKKIWN